MRRVRQVGLTVAILAVSLLGAGCSGGGEEATANQSSETQSATPSETPSKSTPSADDTSGGGMVGAGCAAYAKQVPTGDGSVEGMAKDPVAVAASNNPLLKTLVQAVSGKLNPKVNLVDTLNGGEFTVFAPVDDAFGKIPASTIEGLKTDDKTLTSILTYHVVAGQIAPGQIVGEHKTVQGGTVTVTGSGDNLKVNDANVICGGVKTANATVYLIDSVLMPS
ncbi:fasciclin domain-containing protein [Flindersiella endophytica]